MTLVKAVVLLAIAAYFALVALMFAFQRTLQYFPQRLDRTPAELGLSGIDRVSIASTDGEHFIAWYVPAPEGRPTILFFHGNAAEVWDRAKRIEYFRARGFGFLAVEYRGFGASSGSPSEAGLVRDARAAHDWLVAKGVAPGSILLIGESLGTAVAVQLAAGAPVAGLALEAPFSSAVELGAARYPFLPVRLLMKDQYHTIDFIGQIHAPLLITHARDDHTVPFGQGRRLFEAAAEPKQFVELESGGHDVIFEEPTWAREVEFFEAVCERRQAR